MKNILYQGYLRRDDYGFLCLANSHDEYRLAEKIQDDWNFGENVFVRFFIASAQASLENLNEALIAKTMGGVLHTEYVLEAYSEYTIEEWEESCKVGGHSLIDELDTFEGKYAIIIFEQSS